MEAKNFEYAALKAMAPNVHSAMTCNRLDEYLPTSGLTGTMSGGTLVVWPARSTRKNPACIVITKDSGLSGWSHATEWGPTKIYVYKAGDFDMTKGKERARVS